MSQRPTRIATLAAILLACSIPLLACGNAPADTTGGVADDLSPVTDSISVPAVPNNAAGVSRLVVEGTNGRVLNRDGREMAKITASQEGSTHHVRIDHLGEVLDAVMTVTESPNGNRTVTGTVNGAVFEVHVARNGRVLQQHAPDLVLGIQHRVLLTALADSFAQAAREKRHPAGCALAAIELGVGIFLVEPLAIAFGIGGMVASC
jgi:hypothetical protein